MTRVTLVSMGVGVLVTPSKLGKQHLTVLAEVDETLIRSHEPMTALIQLALKIILAVNLHVLPHTLPLDEACHVGLIHQSGV